MNRRPKLQMIAPGASPEEAAAVAAAIEQFMRNTTPVHAAPPAPVSAWKRTALHEGVNRQPQTFTSWA